MAMRDVTEGGSLEDQMRELLSVTAVAIDMREDERTLPALLRQYRETAMALAGMSPPDDDEVAALTAGADAVR